MLTTYTASVVVEEKPDYVVNADDDNNVENVEQDIDEIWSNEGHSNKVTFVDDDIYSKRSFTPVWKKSDDEKPVWGDDEDDNECEKYAK